MEKLVNNTFSLWREQGSLIIKENFEVFRNLVAQAKDFAQCGNYDAAVVYAEIAASYATYNHCGLFASPELEQLLFTIGQTVIKGSSYPNQSMSAHKVPKKILHVSAYAHGIGGLSRMIWRWIQQDKERSHSVVLTRQALAGEIPKTLKDAVSNSHGKIYVLDQTIGSVISWAKKLRQIAASADMVVLHMPNHDVIPIIAFANKEQSPPIIYLNHSDHWFWLGVSISDVVADMRYSGMRLSQQRRGVEIDRNALLPIILSPIERQLSRTQAKQQLGLSEDAILLLSIARSCKYKTIDGISFADAHVRLLQQYDKAVLIVIGPGNSEDWSAAIKQTQGRIKVLPQTENTAVFYQAADIYVDSFPVISNTSLLEAGSYGVPLVSRYPYSDNCGILGADTPGLTGNLIRVQDLEEYTKVLSRLVEDEEFRLFLGEKTRKKIIETHWGNNWQPYLEDLYLRAYTVPRINISLPQMDQIFIGEPDVFFPEIFHHEKIESDLIIQANLRLMPITQRLQIWRRFAKKHGSFPTGLLLPEWLYWSVRKSNLGNILPKRFSFLPF